MDKKDKIFQAFDFEIKSTDEDKREITGIGSKQISDRDNDIVYIDGIDIKNYKKSPRVLWSHEYYSPPIGKTTKVWKDGKKLMFKMKFVEEEVYPFADTIYKLLKGGYLNSFSIGFRPDYKEAKFNEKRNGYDFYKSDLIEISVVNVPSNPDAIVTSKNIQKAITDEVVTKEEIDKMIESAKEIEEDEEDDEVMDKAKELIKDMEQNDIYDIVLDLTKRLDQIESKLDEDSEQIGEVDEFDNYIGELLNVEEKEEDDGFEEFCKEIVEG